jgi:hypothetical protein
MKKSICLTLLGLLVLATTAMAGSKLPYDSSRPAVAIQNLVGLSPLPAVSNCTTATKTKGTIVTVTNSAGYIGLKWTAVSAAGAPIVVKRRLNSNTAFMPESSGTMVFNGGITGVAFDVYSAASGTATTVCVELE